jgi:hypothetical protein
MSRDRRGFNYALEPVRSLTGWDLNDKLRELSELNAAVDAQQQNVDTLASHLAAARTEILRLRHADRPLDIVAQRNAHAFLAQVDRQLTLARQALAESLRKQEAAMAEIKRLRRFADNLDRHKDEAGQAHDQQQALRAFLQADDAWLQRTQRRKAQ